jgi:hypothetical protein
MGNIQVIENEKHLNNHLKKKKLILLLLGDQKNFDCQINGEDQPCR